MSRLQHEWRALQAKYALLAPPILEKNKFVIKGTLPIIDGKGTLWDSFDVRIDVGTDYPKTLPTITETGRKISRSGDWHINEDDSCCVGTPAEQFRKLHGRITLLNWVEEFAIPFLANYIYRRDQGRYFNGEWPHGIKGIYADYAQLYGIADLDLLLQRLRYCSDRTLMSRNSSCFCQSGKKYKRCYLLQPEAHRHYVPKHIIWNDVPQLEKLQKLGKG